MGTTRLRRSREIGRDGPSCYTSLVLNPTPPDKLCDAQGRPYFLWDVDMTLEEFRVLLADPDPEVRAYCLGKLMRQAKPDDVFQLATAEQMLALWPLLERYLGKSREFWTWLFERWEAQGFVQR